MAERRMFAKTIIDSDAFLEMPQSTQLLYFHLSMRADDDGFINKPKSIMREICCKDDDMKILIGKKFVIPFESGVVVIKHWKIHNYIQKDRYSETKYKEEKATLELDENKAYKIPEIDACIHDVSTLETQVRLGKVSIDKNKTYVCDFESLWSKYPRKKEKAKAYKCYQTRLKDGYSESEMMQAVTNYAAECKKNKTAEKYIKLGATFLGVNTPFIDYMKGEDNGRTRVQANGDNEYDCAKAFAERYADAELKELPFVP